MIAVPQRAQSRKQQCGSLRHTICFAYFGSMEAHDQFHEGTKRLNNRDETLEPLSHRLELEHGSAIQDAWRVSSLDPQAALEGIHRPPGPHDP